MNSSESALPPAKQSLSLPGSIVFLPPPLREIAAEAARDAARARAAAMMRAITASATLRLSFIHCSIAGRNDDSTIEVASGLFSRSLVWP